VNAGIGRWRLHSEFGGGPVEAQLTNEVSNVLLTNHFFWAALLHCPSEPKRYFIPRAHQIDAQPNEARLATLLSTTSRRTPRYAHCPNALHWVDKAAQWERSCNATTFGRQTTMSLVPGYSISYPNSQTRSPLWRLF
jgi:hypothetical protein